MPTKLDAPGIPSFDQYGDPLASITPGQWLDFIRQRHDALRAGRHQDVRIGSPETGLYSWATRKELPTPGQRIALFQQPLHEYAYGDFEGEIPVGQYGAGKVKKEEKGRALVTKVTDQAVHFTLGDRRNPERFVLIKPTKPNDKRWLLINTTITTRPPYDKVHYKSISPDKAEHVFDSLKPGSSVQAKLDGASMLYELSKDRIEAYSYRDSKQTGYPIVHTERIFDKGQKPVPKELVGSILRGELYGTKNDEVIHPAELGGVLNATLSNSAKMRQDRGIDLKNLLYDVAKLGKKDVESLPYQDRYNLLQQFVDKVPMLQPNSKIPEQAQTPEEAKALWNRILADQHPETTEGVVIHPPQGIPSKIKQRPEFDVYIRNFFPGEGKYKNLGVGGFYYSFEPEGKVVGKVGTGLNDAMRMDFYNNPDLYLGRKAKVLSQEKLPSGALRAPSLLSLHEDY